MKQRANDTDYPFRAHSAFSHLTGWGSDSEPGAVLVFEPNGGGHTATVYFRERAGRDSEEFYANPAIGEFWIGARPSLAHVAADLAVETRGLEEFDRVLRGSTPRPSCSARPTRRSPSTSTMPASATRPRRRCRPTHRMPRSRSRSAVRTSPMPSSPECSPSCDS